MCLLVVFGSVGQSHQATIRDFFRCDNWNPIYELGAYEAVCYDGTEGFVWATACQIVIVFLTFIIWTLRAAIYEADAPPPDTEIRPYQPPNPSCCCSNRKLEKNGKKRSTEKNVMDRTDTAMKTNNNKPKNWAEIEAMVEADEERLLEQNMPHSSSGGG